MKQPKSLFETTVNNGELDPSFVHIRDSNECCEDREYIAELWQRYKELADSNFHDQLQRKGNFHSRIWEMRLACILMNKFPKIKSNNKGPDICISLDSIDVHCEAVAPATTEELERNHYQAKTQPMSIPEDETILRFTTSLREKHQRYICYLNKGLVKQSDAYIIAISAGNLHWAYDYSEGISLIVKPLFGIGNLYVSIKVGSGEQVGKGYEHTPTRHKTNREGKKVPIGADLFLGKEFYVVSAVLFSPHHVKNRPEVEGSDLELFRNPFAKVPLPKCFLGVGREWAVIDGYLQIIEDWGPKNLGIVPSCLDDSILDP